MDDWFSGSDYSFNDDSGSGSDFVPDYSGSDTSGDTASSDGLFGGGSDSSSWDTSDTDANSPWASGDAGTTGGYNSSTGSYDWGSLFGQAGAAAVKGYASYEADKSKSAQAEKDKEKFAAFQMALQEQYYQAHGKQLEGAIGKYAQFQKPAGGPGPFAGLSGAPSPYPTGQGTVFEQSQQQQAQQAPGLLAYGY